MDSFEQLDKQKRDIIIRISRARTNANLSARALSQKIEMNDGYINRLESKKDFLPSVEVLLKIIDVCGLTIEEFAALDTISANEELCQRDLAKMILKDRANTGKLLDSLESKGLIKRELAIKNNRPVKFVSITEQGEKVYQEIYTRLEPHHKVVEEKIANTDLAKVGELLKDLREVLEDTIDIDI